MDCKTRNDLLAIHRASLAAADPAEAVLRHLSIEGSLLRLHSVSTDEKLNLDDFRRIIVIGSGKASAMMAEAIESLLGTRIHSGLVAVKDGNLRPLSRIECVEASHPVPDERGLDAARRIVSIAGDADERDLIIALISGGASSLLPLPPDGISLDDKRAATQLLLKSGASISEMNAVRKHLSLIKGGLLAREAFPAAVLNIMVSDVVGDRIDVIGSGPLAPDSSTFTDAVSMCERYGIYHSLPGPVRDYLERQAINPVNETPKPGDPCFERVFSLIIASNRLSLEAARQAAADMGYHALVLSSMIEGDTAQAARFHAAIAREAEESGNPASPPACIISGGETTVLVRGDGLGGRNTEFALEWAAAMENSQRSALLCAGTDGTDGPTDAAGAFADGGTLSRGRAAGMDYADYLARNDTYTFFRNIGDLLVTGPSGTNVMDVRIMLIV